ncbi:hypothetical protein ACUADT_003668 [Enterobacter cloacae]
MLIKKIINVGIIVSLTVAGVNLYRYLQERDDGKGIVSCSLPTGNFELLNLDGRLQPVDESTGKVIGFLERRSNGEIQLTTADGFAPNVTPCLSGKLSTEQLNSLPLHE